MRVLLVEDDRMIGAAVEAALSDAAYAADWVRDGRSAIEAVASQTYDIVLLDLGLPKMDGMEVLRSIRGRHDAVPVLIITARDAVESRIQGLDLGADDYVLKPFEMAELLARMRAVARRKGGVAGPLLCNDVLSLDVSAKTVSLDGAEVPLSAREFALSACADDPAGGDPVAQRTGGSHVWLGQRGGKQRRRIHHPLAAQETRQRRNKEREGRGMAGTQDPLRQSLQFRLSAWIGAPLAGRGGGRRCVLVHHRL